jgi:hypothetical protein
MLLLLPLLWLLLLLPLCAAASESASASNLLVVVNPCGCCRLLLPAGIAGRCWYPGRRCHHRGCWICSCSKAA